MMGSWVHRLRVAAIGRCQRVLKVEPMADSPLRVPNIAGLSFHDRRPRGCSPSPAYVLDISWTSVPVNVIKNPGDFLTPGTVTTDPNPVFAELQPATPPKPSKKHHRPKKPKPAAAAAPAAAPDAGSPFPDPNSAPPPAAPAPKR
jgi:hypothetical protein